jgi:hypothetical protein
MKQCSSCPLNMVKQCRLEFRDGVPPCARKSEESPATDRQQPQLAIAARAVVDAWKSNAGTSSLHQFITQLDTALQQQAVR